MVAPEWLFLSGDMGAVMDGFVGAPVPAERVDPSICVLNDDDRKGSVLFGFRERCQTELCRKVKVREGGGI